MNQQTNELKRKSRYQSANQSRAKDADNQSKVCDGGAKCSVSDCAEYSVSPIYNSVPSGKVKRPRELNHQNTHILCCHLAMNHADWSSMIIGL